MEPPRNPALPPRPKGWHDQQKRGYYEPRRGARTKQESWSSQLSCQALAISVFDHVSEAGVSAPSWPGHGTGCHNMYDIQRQHGQQNASVNHHALQETPYPEMMPRSFWSENPNKAHSSSLSHREWPGLQYYTFSEHSRARDECFHRQSRMGNTTGSSQQTAASSTGSSKSSSGWPQGRQSSATTMAQSTHLTRNANAWQPSIPVMRKEPLLRNPGTKVVSGRLLNLQRESFLTEDHMQSIFDDVEKRVEFRQFAGRAIVDVKLSGTSSMPKLNGPYARLNPLLAVMVELARCSLHDGHELALVQLIVNHFKNGGNEVKPHTHRCRQVCVSLGASREVVVEGSVLQMKHGDCLPLAGEVHSVPRATGLSASRISVCLFYGSNFEFARGLLCVNATNGKFGNSHWWVHPEDMRRETAVADDSCGGLSSLASDTCYFASLDRQRARMPTGAGDLMYGAETWRHTDLVVPKESDNVDLKPHARVWRGKKRPEAKALHHAQDPFAFQ